MIQGIQRKHGVDTEVLLARQSVDARSEQSAYIEHFVQGDDNTVWVPGARSVHVVDFGSVCALVPRCKDFEEWKHWVVSSESVERPEPLCAIMGNPIWISVRQTQEGPACEYGNMPLTTWSKLIQVLRQKQKCLTLDASVLLGVVRNKAATKISKPSAAKSNKQGKSRWLDMEDENEEETTPCADDHDPDPNSTRKKRSESDESFSDISQNEGSEDDAEVDENYEESDSCESDKEQETSSSDVSDEASVSSGSAPKRSSKRTTLKK
jgi:hypothetical protein